MRVAANAWIPAGAEYEGPPCSFCGRPSVSHGQEWDANGVLVVNVKFCETHRSVVLVNDESPTPERAGRKEK